MNASIQSLAEILRKTFLLLAVAVARQRRHWFEGLWANAGEPVPLKQA